MNEIPNKISYLIGIMEGDEFWCRAENEDVDQAVLLLKQIREQNPDKECTIYRKMVSYTEVIVK